MSTEYFTLSKKEKELMDIFWAAEAPLSRSEILTRAELAECSWKPNSVHILVNSLLDKKAVKVAGVYLSSRKLGRTFEPDITREEYAVMQVKLAMQKARAEGVDEVKTLAAALVDDTTDAAVLDGVIKAAKARKKELETAEA